MIRWLPASGNRNKLSRQ